MDEFFNLNYAEIITMSSKICKGSVESEDVAHFAIEQFLHHERVEEIIGAGRGMNFLSGIMWRSFNSSTSPYHTVYRQKGRFNQGLEGIEEIEYDEYDVSADEAITAISGILEDMSADKSELWYRAELFKMYLETSNYSELSRRTRIPRTSISIAVEEAKQYIREQLKIQNINYEL